MSDKLKNIISNLIGLGVIALGTVTYLENDNLFNFVSLLAVGLACFLFKVSETKAYLKKLLNKKVGETEECNHQVKMRDSIVPEPINGNETGIIGDMPDPNKEEK